jgi:hypothetical protein
LALLPTLNCCAIRIVGCHTQRGMMVKAAPTLSLIVTQFGVLLQILMVITPLRCQHDGFTHRVIQQVDIGEKNAHPFQPHRRRNVHAALRFPFVYQACPELTTS